MIMDVINGPERHEPESADPARPTAAGLDPDLLARLRAPFPLHETKQVPIARDSTYTHAILRARISPLLLYWRLDEVLGVDGYEETYLVLSTHPFTVQCELTIRNVTKTGVGEGKTVRAAYHAALAHAALRFGIGWQIARLGRFSKGEVVMEEAEEHLYTVLQSESLPPTIR